MTDEELKYFNEHFRFTKFGPNLWRAYNKVTNESASPVYNSKEAAIYYVIRELKQKMDEHMDKMLGGTGDVNGIFDDPTLCGGLSDAIPGDGSKEKF